MTQQDPPAVTQDTDSQTADVIVVGAGPAGSSTAYYLASAGLDVLLLEKSRFPEKRSAATVSPRARLRP